MREIRYRNDMDIQFVETLNSRVDAFFLERNADRKAGGRMYLKTILALLYFFGIYTLILFGGIDNLVLLGVLWACMGLGQAILGMTIMHDKVHGAYSSNKWLNLFLEIPIIAIGVDSYIWSIEHNFFHHNYTNIEGIDQDIHPRYLFRFSRHQPKRWFHRFQHIYASVVYALLTVEWVTFKDFVKIRKYYHEGFVKSKQELWFRVVLILAKKIIFFMLYLVIPMVILDQLWYIALLMFCIKLAVSGFVMTVIFQTAHVVPNCDFLDPNEQEIKTSWHRHQLNTTADFATKDKIVTYLLGGLNFQIEHHLYPGMCHVHYPEIAEIVKRTALEYGMPYHENKSVWSTISQHYGMLKRNGQR